MRKKRIVLMLLWSGAFFYAGILRAEPSFFYNNSAEEFEQPYQYKIIPAPGNTWGYDILKDQKIFIHQPIIPGLQGKKGFRTKQDAAKVARLVITRIKKGEMPPSVTTEDLRVLKITN